MPDNKDQTLTRNEHGTITGGTMTSERAKYLAGLAVQKRNSGRTERAAKLLQELGGLEWDAADESLKTLAVQAVEGGPGSVTAHRLLLQRLGKLTETGKGAETENWDPEGGEPCPTCGGVRIALLVSADGKTRLESLMDDSVEEALDLEEEADAA